MSSPSQLPAESVVVSCPYSAEWVTKIKRFVNPEHRAYHPTTKEWEIEIGLINVVEELCRECFADVIVENIDAAGDPQRPPTEVFTSYHRMIAHLPNDGLRRVYKTALTAVHPDLGGSHEAAVAVNAAWDEIRKDRGL